MVSEPTSNGIAQQPPQVIPRNPPHKGEQPAYILSSARLCRHALAEPLTDRGLRLGVGLGRVQRVPRAGLEARRDAGAEVMGVDAEELSGEELEGGGGHWMGLLLGGREHLTEEEEEEGEEKPGGFLRPGQGSGPLGSGKEAVTTVLKRILRPGGWYAVDGPVTGQRSYLRNQDGKKECEIWERWISRGE